MCDVQYLKHSSDSVFVEDKSLVLFGQAATSRCELAACELAVLVVDRLMSSAGMHSVCQMASVTTTISPAYCHVR